MTGNRTANGATTDRSHRPFCTSTGDAGFRAPVDQEVAVVTVFRSPRRGSGLTDRARQREQPSCARKSAGADAEGPRMDNSAADGHASDSGADWHLPGGPTRKML